MSLPLPVDLLPYLLPAAGTTVALLVGAGIFALVVAFIAGMARLSRFRLVRVLSQLYVEVFRGSNVLVQIYIWYYVLPVVGVSLAPFPTAIIALGLNEGAYASEVVRGAVLGVPRGQTEAALALNMPYRTAFRRIVLPQALPLMVRPLGNNLIDLLKATSLVSFIAITDLAFAGQLIVTREGRAVEVYALLLLIYFALSLLFGLFITRIADPMLARWRPAQ